MNDQDQETSVIAKTLELLDKGEKMKDILPLIPHGFEDKAMEYAELVKWIESERDAILAPVSSLQKILAAIDTSEKKIEEKKASHIPLSELIPVKAKAAFAKTVENIPIQKKVLAPVIAEAPLPSEKPGLSWNRFFAKDSTLAAPISVSGWKVWAPASAVALFLAFIGINGGSTPQGKPDIVALNVPAESAPVASDASGAFVPAAKTASLMKAAAVPASSGASASPSDQYAALYSSSDREAAAANSSDSDLAVDNAAPIGTAKNSYNENTI